MPRCGGATKPLFEMRGARCEEIVNNKERVQFRRVGEPNARCRCARALHCEERRGGSQGRDGLTCFTPAVAVVPGRTAPRRISDHTKGVRKCTDSTVRVAHV
jgi:hypothetical protein